MSEEQGHLGLCPKDPPAGAEHLPEEELEGPAPRLPHHTWAPA